MGHFSHTTESESVTHIALIEDSDDLRAAIAALLQSTGLHVETYVCGEDFLLADPSPRPNCLITDLHLPGMSGLALLEKLDRRKDGLPAILMSASTKFTDWDNPTPPGCIGFLSKPFDADELFELVGKALHGQSGFMKLS
jgi:FixJ family two-component response regulator